MKKSLFILAAALCGSASAVMADTQSVTFDTTLGTTENPLADAVFQTTGSLTFSNIGLTVNPTSYADAAETGGILRPVVGKSVLLPNVRIDKDSTNKWALTFTLTNSSSNELTLNSLSLSGLTAYNLYGELQGSARTIDLTLSSVGFSVENSTVSLASGNATGDHSTTLSFGEGFVLGADENVTLTLTADNAAGGNALVGFSGMSVDFAVTPEPTTATLSLLALAGLCARRRRK